MGAVVGGLVLAGVLVIMVLAFSWQAWRGRRGAAAALYVLDEAAAFVHDRLSPEAQGRLSRGRVQRILEWQMEYQQAIGPYHDGPTVLGGGEAMEHILARGVDQGMALEPVDVAEVMAAEVDYLVAIGAVGTPAAEAGS
jgi:hypothetical protein